MKTEIQQELVRRLRSGDYSQARGVLNRVGFAEWETHQENKMLGHCCLGVLCEIAVDEGVIDKQLDEYGRKNEYGPDGSRSFPPNEVADWAGLKYRTEEDPPTIYFDMTGVDLTERGNIKDWHKFGDRVLIPAHELNDDFKLSFDEIADLIEAGKIVEEVPSIHESDYYKRSDNAEVF